MGKIKVKATRTHSKWVAAEIQYETQVINVVTGSLMSPMSSISTWNEGLGVTDVSRSPQRPGGDIRPGLVYEEGSRSVPAPSHGRAELTAAAVKLSPFPAASGGLGTSLRGFSSNWPFVVLSPFRFVPDLRKRTVTLPVIYLSPFWMKLPI